MKILLKNQLLIFLLTFAICSSVNGQDVIRQVSCFDSTLKLQADSLKKEMSAQGFIVVREASMSMESGYEMPVVVPLTLGKRYFRTTAVTPHEFKIFATSVPSKL